MTTKWEPEADEQTHVFGKDDWYVMTVPLRSAMAKEAGLEGKLGGKSWDDLTPEERATIIDPEKRPAKLSLLVKAHVALEDSNKETWGMVKYMKPGEYNIEAAEGELVGNWSRSPKDGLIHVFLETPLAALNDRAIKQFAEYAEIRKAAASAPKARKARGPRAPVSEPGPSEAQVAISNMRKLIGK